MMGSRTPPGAPWAAISSPVASAGPADDWDAIGDLVSPAAPAVAPRLGSPTGRVHDGDTFGLSTGQNARLYGADAFELSQRGRRRDGSFVPLGIQSRDLLRSSISPASTIAPTGTQSYNRPVVSLANGGNDYGLMMLDKGMGLAAPEYMRSDPDRLRRYMDAERIARLNRRGAFGTEFQSPTDFRHHKPDPWAAPEPAADGKGIAFFPDEPTPQQGLRPDIERAYVALAQDPNTTGPDLLKFAADNGFTIAQSDAAEFDRGQRSGVKIADSLSYRVAPRVLTDPGDGTVGATVRGFADPINVLDEAGAVVDTLGGTPGRENVWSSDRRFGDILWNNLDQNRSILEFDEDRHPWARFGGQLASGAIIPGASTEGVGFAAARAALRSGASRYVAQNVARNAFRNRLMSAGAIEGAVAGAGAGEGGPIDRLPSTLAGGAIGGAGGLALGVGLPYASTATRQVRNYIRDRGVNALDNEAQNIGAPAPTNPGAPVDQWDAISSVAPEVGPHGPIHRYLTGDYHGAVARLTADRGGEVPGALSHPDVGPIDLIWGNANGGLRHIVEKHPDVLPDLPEIVAQMGVTNASPNRLQLESPDHLAKVRLDYDGLAKSWLLTAFRKETPATAEDGRVVAGDRDGSPGLGDAPDLAPGASNLNAPPPPHGFMERGPSVAAMSDQPATPSISAPVNDWDAISVRADGPDAPGARVPDRIDVWDQIGEPVNPLHVAEPDLSPRSRVRPMAQSASAEEMARIARGVDPGDVTPIASNEVGSVDEAAAIGAGVRPELEAPNERNALPPYRALPNGPLRRDPMDLLSWLRTQGGVREDRGELASIGLSNKARVDEFARSEGFLGKLIRDDGLSLDDAAHRAWEAGWFPDHPERPTVPEFLDALDQTNRAGPGRVFHPDDHPALDAYRAARQSRNDIERAASEGAPFVEDRGQPIGLDDLDANQPPATAYEDLPSVGGIAGNIRLDGLDSADDIRRVLINTDAKAGGFDAARRGVVSHAETRALASELGMTPDDLLRRRHGQALNAEQALAARQILARSAEDLLRLARRAQGGSDDDLASFREAWLRHAAIQEQVSGATAEAGRALSQFRQSADAAAAPRVHSAMRKRAIDEAGGREQLEEAAQAIIDLQDQGKGSGEINRFAADAVKPRFRDKLVELYYNSLLSGPQTHVVNALSNAMTSALQAPEYATAAAMGGVRRVVARKDVDRVLGSELGPRIVGMMQGAKEGLRQFARTARTGHVPDHVTKVEAQTQEAISGFKGKIIRTPTRLLAASDEIFKAIARRSELNGAAVRKATSEGLKGDALTRRIADLSQNPPDDMFEQSLDYARYLTFQRPLGKVGNLVTQITQEMPLLKLIVPFVRTPTNILKFAAERSPAAPLLREVRQDIAAGGARRDLAIARIGLGTGLGMLVTQWAHDGLITGGGPADDNARATMFADGWQPYSIRVGNKWVSYQRFDPLATTLGVAADLVETGEYMTDTQREHSAMLVTAAIIKNLSNKVWLSGITDLSQAIDDPERYGSGFVARMAGSVAIPAIVSQAARVVDPVSRETSGPIDRVQSRIPYLSRSLLPKRNIWGEPITMEGGVGPDMISPFRVSTVRNDPVARELLKIGAGIGKPSRMVGGKRLDDATYNRYLALSGQELRRDLERYVPSPAWSAASIETAQDAIERSKRESRKRVRDSMLGGRGR